jgi:WhiB family redox-sensing transcriptional regulator
MNPARQPWMADALCRQVDPESFFAEKGESDVAKSAKRLCALCDVRNDCLVFALDMEGDSSEHLRFGIFAGFTPLERARMARARRERRAA